MRILSKPKGNAEEYGRWSVNPFVGCWHKCLYCYLKKGVWKNTLGGKSPQLKKGVLNEDHAKHIAMAEILDNKKQIIKDGGVFMTFTSDPLILRRTFFLFNEIARECNREKIPVTVLTKVGLDEFRGHMDLFLSYWGTIRNLSMGWTLTGHDELEPFASKNDDRIELMYEYHKMCSPYFTKLWASIEPVIDFNSSFNMVERALNSGCRHFKIGLLTCNTHVVRKEIKLGEYKFDAYKREECIRFINNVMELTEGLATVYWKNSFVEFLGSAPIDGMTADEFLHQWPHSVDKNWRFFKTESEES